MQTFTYTPNLSFAPVFHYGDSARFKLTGIPLTEDHGAAILLFAKAFGRRSVPSGLGIYTLPCSMIEHPDMSPGDFLEEVDRKLDAWKIHITGFVPPGELTDRVSDSIWEKERGLISEVRLRMKRRPIGIYEAAINPKKASYRLQRIG